MTNVWTTVSKQVETWGAATFFRMTATVGSFSLAGIAANLIAPLRLTANVGVFSETGVAANLVYSGSGSLPQGSFYQIIFVA